jgi:hypothetical protein
MTCLQVDRYTVWSDNRIQSISDLLADPFLNRQSLGEHAHKSCELGKTNDVFAGDVPNVDVTKKGQRMVLAQ